VDKSPLPSRGLSGEGLERLVQAKVIWKYMKV